MAAKEQHRHTHTSRITTQGQKVCTREEMRPGYKTPMLLRHLGTIQVREELRELY